MAVLRVKRTRHRKQRSSVRLRHRIELKLVHVSAEVNVNMTILHPRIPDAKGTASGLGGFPDGTNCCGLEIFEIKMRVGRAPEPGAAHASSSSSIFAACRTGMLKTLARQ